jgi:hypothetical protein
MAGAYYGQDHCLVICFQTDNSQSSRISPSPHLYTPHPHTVLPKGLYVYIAGNTAGSVSWSHPAAAGHPGRVGWLQSSDVLKVHSQARRYSSVGGGGPITPPPGQLSSLRTRGGSSWPLQHARHHRHRAATRTAGLRLSGSNTEGNARLTADLQVQPPPVRRRTVRYVEIGRRQHHFAAVAVPHPRLLE